MKKLFKDRKPDKVLVTVHGLLQEVRPAAGRPGCVLRVTDGQTVGRYYVPLAPDDCRREFPEGRTVSFKLEAGAKPGENGIYDTAGGRAGLWKTA